MPPHRSGARRPWAFSNPYAKDCHHLRRHRAARDFWAGFLPAAGGPLSGGRRWWWIRRWIWSFIGGPTSVQEELAEDRIDTRRSGLARWNAWKDSLDDRFGIKFSVEYNAILQGYSGNTADVDDSSGGIARFFGSWTPVGKGTKNHGSLIFRVDNRHR